MSLAMFDLRPYVGKLHVFLIGRWMEDYKSGIVVPGRDI